MAKLQMKRIRLLALRKDRKPLMEKLQRLGAVEIEAEEQPPDGFDRLDMDAQAQGFERSAQTARQALETAIAGVEQCTGTVEISGMTGELTSQLSSGAS